MRILIGTCLLLFYSVSVLAQECDTSVYPLSAPTERYTDNGDGTVMDKMSGSIWMRCSLGQTWDGKTCTGEVKLYNWAEIETLADEFNLDGYADHDDWRLPNLPELATLTERMCKSPRINLEVFPSTPNLAYWTVMTKPATDLVYVMHFGEGGVDAFEKTYRGPVRMLRGEKWWVPPSIREMRKQEQESSAK